MTCNGCVNKVKTTLEKTDGVKSAEVSLKENSAVILYDDSVTDEASLKKTVNSTGFKAVDCKDAKAACDKGAKTACDKKATCDKDAKAACGDDCTKDCCAAKK